MPDAPPVPVVLEPEVRRVLERVAALRSIALPALLAHASRYYAGVVCLDCGGLGLAPDGPTCTRCKGLGLLNLGGRRP